MASNLLTLRHNLSNNERFTEIYLTHILTGSLTSTCWSGHIQTNEQTQTAALCIDVKTITTLILTVRGFPRDGGFMCINKIEVTYDQGRAKSKC